jgi:hypothetical protein
MVTQPRVIVAATTDIATSIESLLTEECRNLGLALQVGPNAGKSRFDNSEELIYELSKLNPTDLFDTLLVVHIGVDLMECFRSSVLRTQSPWHNSSINKPGIAMELVLRFPQLLPVFLTPFAPPDGEGEWGEFKAWLAEWVSDADVEAEYMVPGWEQLHFATPLNGYQGLIKNLQRFASGFRSIFDPTGFRTLLRNRFLAQVFGSETRKRKGWDNTSVARGKLNDRLRKLAVIIDEEQDLTLLIGYSFYKFGYRSWMMSSHAELINKNAPSWVTAKNALLARDIDLRFPDMPSSDEPSSMRQLFRDIYSDQWSKIIGNLKDCQVRVISQDPNIVTAREAAAYKHKVDVECDGLKAYKARIDNAPDNLNKNRQIDSKVIEKESLRLGQTCGCSTPHKYIGLTKPLMSIYAATGLILDEGEANVSVLSCLSQSEESRRVSHGAPYFNLRIASDLIEQSRKCRECPELRSALVAALLAQEAYSLLLGMSRNTSLSALREMHLAEAKIECSSTGVAHSVSIKARRADLDETVSNISPGVPGSNFLAKLWADLRLVYKDGEQFEASEKANIESLVNTNWIFGTRGHFASKSLFIQNLVKAFKQAFLLTLFSFSYLLIFLFLWAFVLTIVFCNLQTGWHFALTCDGFVNFMDVYARVLVAISRAEAISTQGLSIPDGKGFLYRLTDILCAFTSVLAIGLIVSIIFRKSTRG